MPEEVSIPMSLKYDYSGFHARAKRNGSSSKALFNFTPRELSSITQAKLLHKRLFRVLLKSFLISPFSLSSVSRKSCIRRSRRLTAENTLPAPRTLAPQDLEPRLRPESGIVCCNRSISGGFVGIGVRKDPASICPNLSQRPAQRVNPIQFFSMCRLKSTGVKTD